MSERSTSTLPVLVEQPVGRLGRGGVAARERLSYSSAGVAISP